ncbi:MAG TPA: molecular chaperone TorD family protein [Usitatibacter sp.]|nr:molecular chaperone TorD family protein [Usitatibacter sp.]
MSVAEAARVAVHRALPPEETARADFYALIARLLHSPPDNALLANVASAPALPADGDARLATAWQRLVDASSAMDADAAAEEYELLFGGVGKARVSIYAGFYAAAASEHPRVRLQTDMAALGLARPDQVTEPEDHFAALFDVMRILVAGGAGRSPATLAEQRRFYAGYVEPSAARFLAAVGSAPEANYYRHVAALAAAFTALESESFQLD